MTINAVTMAEFDMIPEGQISLWQAIIDDAEPDQTLRVVRDRIKTMLMQAFPAMAPEIGRLVGGPHLKALSLGVPDHLSDAAEVASRLTAAVKADPERRAVKTPLGIHLCVALPERLRKHLRFAVVPSNRTRPKAGMPPGWERDANYNWVASEGGAKSLTGAAKARLDGEAELDRLLAEVAPESASAPPAAPTQEPFESPEFDAIFGKKEKRGRKI